MIVLKCIHDTDKSKNFCFVSYRLKFSSGCHLGFLYSKACKFIYESNNFITEYSFVFTSRLNKNDVDLLHSIRF